MEGRGDIGREGVEELKQGALQAKRPISPCCPLTQLHYVAVSLDREEVQGLFTIVGLPCLVHVRGGEGQGSCACKRVGRGGEGGVGEDREWRGRGGEGREEWWKGRGREGRMGEWGEGEKGRGRRGNGMRERRGGERGEERESE